MATNAYAAVRILHFDAQALEPLIYYLLYKVYFVSCPFCSTGGRHETKNASIDVWTTLISAGGPGTAKNN